MEPPRKALESMHIWPINLKIGKWDKMEGIVESFIDFKGHHHVPISVSLIESTGHDTHEPLHHNPQLSREPRFGLSNTF